MKVIKTYPFLFGVIIFGITCNCPSKTFSQKQPEQVKKLSQTVIKIHSFMLTVEIANTWELRSRGLMFRQKLDENAGMLFIFPYEQRLSFWMKNTHIPLSLAYINKKGKISEIINMSPHDETPRVSKEKVCYALELKQGWFKRHRIKKGVYVKGLPPLSLN